MKLGHINIPSTKRLNVTAMFVVVEHYGEYTNPEAVATFVSRTDACNYVKMMKGEAPHLTHTIHDIKTGQIANTGD